MDTNLFNNENNENIYNMKNKDEYSFKTIGLTEDVIREISEQKNEPKWMLDLRLKALKKFDELKMPTWGPDLSERMILKLFTIA